MTETERKLTELLKTYRETVDEVKRIATECNEELWASELDYILVLAGGNWDRAASVVDEAARWALPVAIEEVEKNRAALLEDLNKYIKEHRSDNAGAAL